MANEMNDNLSSQIVGSILRHPTTLPRCSIFKVPHHLRKVNEKAYEPQVIAIGPYHHGKDHLKEMEAHKYLYLNSLLGRRENDMRRCVESMMQLKEQARACYAEPTSLETDEFVKMMLLDGCFIIKILLRDETEQPRDDGDTPRDDGDTPREDGDTPRDDGDTISKFPIILNAVIRDMFLLENQLPFFVVENLFSITNEGNNIRQRISAFFGRHLPMLCITNQQTEPHTQTSIGDIKPLLGFLHDHGIGLPSSSEIVEPFKFIRCATELEEAGIKFKEDRRSRLFDIKFENGIMEIPRLEIEDETETLFRNLIAYELLTYKSKNYVTDYIRFMDCLINSSKDVGLLCRRGIIHNCLGDDEVVAGMFNRLCDHVIMSPRNFYYSGLCNNINKHCGRRWNRWMANLRHNYFNTPWSLISFIAALFLLLLTVTQTAFSWLDYIYNDKPVHLLNSMEPVSCYFYS